MNKKTGKNQQALEQQKHDDQKNDEGKPKKLKFLIRAVDVLLKIERIISFGDRWFGDE